MFFQPGMFSFDIGPTEISDKGIRLYALTDDHRVVYIGTIHKMHEKDLVRAGTALVAGLNTLTRQ